MKHYIAPTTTVVEMKHKEMLMAGTTEPQGIRSSRQSYGTAQTEEWN